MGNNNDNNIQHHGEKGQKFGPPRTISNKATGDKVFLLTAAANNKYKVPDALLREIKEFLEHMATMPEEKRIKKSYQLIRKINNKISNKELTDDKGQN